MVVESHDKMKTSVPGEALFGRDGELDWLWSACAAGSARVSLYGPPGVGKSRLVHEFGVRWTDEGRAVTAVDGRSLSGIGDLLEALVHRLELPRLEATETAAVLRHLKAVLSTREELVIVIDDGDHLQEAVARFCRDVGDGTALSVVVTGRRAPESDEFESLRLKPLAPAMAKKCFLARAGRSFRGTEALRIDPEVLDELVHKLDCLPLALELAASRLVILSPEALLERLEERFQLLRIPKTADRPAESTLEETIALSWDLLADVERQVLLQCTAFGGSFELGAAEEIVEIGGDVWVGDVIQTLVEKSFLESWRDEPTGVIRFSLLRVIEEYLRRQADAGLLDRVAHRHGALYLDRLRRWHGAVRGPEGEALLKRICGERSNIEAAFRYFLEADTKKAAECCVRMEPLFEVGGITTTYLEHLGHFLDDGPVEALAEAPHLVARLRLNKARMVNQAGDPEQAREEIEAVEALYRQWGEQLEVDFGEIALCHGHIARNQGQLSEARRLWSEGLEVVEDRFVRFRLQEGLGLLLLDQSRFQGDSSSQAPSEKAMELLEKAHKFGRSQTHALYRVQASTARAMALHLNQESHRALQSLRREARAQRERDYTHGYVRCMYYIGMLECEIGDSQVGLDDMRAMDGVLTHAGMEARRTRNAAQICIMLVRIGDYEEARRWIEETLETALGQGLRVPEMTVRIQAAVLAWEQGQMDEFRLHVDRALDLVEAVGGRTPQALIMALQAFALAVEGELDKARELCAQAVEQVSASSELQKPLYEPRWVVIERSWKAYLELVATAHHLRAGRWRPVYEGFDEVERLEEAAELGSTALARRQARSIAKRVREVFSLPEDTPSAVLHADESFQRYRVDGGEEVDLSTRRPLQRILSLLVRRRLANEPPTPREVVVETAWPEERLDPDSAASRVYSTIYMLRNMGFDGLIVSDERGYRIADNTLIIPTPLALLSERESLDRWWVP